MKRLFILLFCMPLMVLAQNKKYITHTVAAKESLTSIGRQYNINGRELANYNHIDYDKGLALGQVIKIPVGETTTAPVKTDPAKTVTVPAKVVVPAKPVAAGDEKGTPIYHTVARKETLYHISTLYNKVPIADLKKWNNLTTDGLSEGSQLIVGYTKTAAKAVQKKTEPVVVKETPPVKKAEEKGKENVAEPVKKEVVKEIIKEEPVTVPAQNGNRNFNGGTFRSLFSSQAKSSDYINETGEAGIFKSTSGWDDGKYYCLHNAAAPGSIAKITNPINGKSIYAKVLDVIPDIKQNAGLIVRLSNAAADELGVSTATFDCSIIYLK